jgi:hypothetical protein
MSNTMALGGCAETIAIKNRINVIENSKTRREYNSGDEHIIRNHVYDLGMHDGNP